MAIGTPSEIKELMDGQILTIRSGQARRIVSLLRQEHFTKSVNLFGDTVHLVCRDSEEAKMLVANLLDRERIDYEQVRSAQPSLEDVFVSLLGKSNQPASGQRDNVQIAATPAAPTDSAASIF